jgi:hypothetical protein
MMKLLVILLVGVALATMIVLLVATTRQPAQEAEAVDAPFEVVSEFRVRGCANRGQILRFDDRGTTLYVLTSCRGTALWGR